MDQCDDKLGDGWIYSRRGVVVVEQEARSDGSGGDTGGVWISVWRTVVGSGGGDAVYESICEQPD